MIIPALSVATIAVAVGALLYVFRLLGDSRGKEWDDNND